MARACEEGKRGAGARQIDERDRDARSGIAGQIEGTGEDEQEGKKRGKGGKERE